MEVVSNSQLFWLCKSCASLMKDIRLRRSVRIAHDAGIDKVLGDHKQIVTQLKAEIIAEVKNELQANFKSLINSSSHTPMSSTRQQRLPGGAKFRARRLFGEKVPPVHVDGQVANNPSTLATGAAASPSLGTFVAQKSTPKFWLYLSRVSRNVTVEQVAQLACSRLGTNDVEVYSLVAKGRDLQSLAFISFKIGLETQLKEKALTLSTWPAGLVIREFERRSNGVSWEPPVEEQPFVQVQAVEVETVEQLNCTPPQDVMSV